ncbi:hypothetical protein LJB97_02595 [Parabacteroides sp. OttesenSCG-928-O15]|nr:hypothetical protein [Parabacteroides sp. OttesenSCG-928-O15]
MKRIFYVFTVCLFAAVSFTSCDEDDEIFIPTEVVSNLTFTDEDMDPYKIGGTLIWDLPASEENITDYVIYLSETATGRDQKVGEVMFGTSSLAGKASLKIPNGTDLKAYLVVVTKNTMGESTNVAALEITDNTGDLIVTELAFTDSDPLSKTIGGMLTWKLPNPEAYVTGYAIYAADEAAQKGTKIGEVGAGISSFEVPVGTPYKPFIQVIVMKNNVESALFAALSVVDYAKPSTGLFILNGGNQNENNACISYYDIATGKLTQEIYKTANGSGLGDSAEQLLIYGGKMYVTVTGSNRIAILNLDGKLIKSIEPKEGGEPMNPRAMAADNGKVYISYYYGHAVAALDTLSLEVTEKVGVGRYPEHLAVANGKIYVANSGGLDYPNYGKTVSVIDQKSFKVDKEIEVLINPGKIVADSQGDVYVISLGNYNDIKNTLQRIDGKTGEVTVIDKATYMTLVNDNLYTAYAQWGDANITYKKYDALTEKFVDENIIKDGTNITSPYAIAVDPLTEDFYIAESTWGSTSSLYVFSADGKLKGQAIETGGYGAKCLFFN